MYAIIADGGNEVRVPCIFFESFEECESLLLKKGCVKIEEEYIDDSILNSSKTSYYVPDNIIDNNTETKNGDSDVENDWYVPDIFISYYPGCGNVQSFKIIELEIGKSVVAFSLD